MLIAILSSINSEFGLILNVLVAGKVGADCKIPGNWATRIISTTKKNGKEIRR